MVKRHAKSIVTDEKHERKMLKAFKIEDINTSNTCFRAVIKTRTQTKISTVKERDRGVKI